MGYFFFNKFPRRSYLFFLLIIFPFIDLGVTPEEFGSISVFDFISYFVIFFTSKDFFNFSNNKNIYFFLFSLLTSLILISCLKSEFIVNSLFNFLKYLSVFIYSKMLIDECLKDLSFINLIIKYLKLGCILSLIFLLIQLIIGIEFTFYPDLNPNTYLELGTEASRFPSYFQDPQKYAQYLSMIGFLFLRNKETKSTPGILNIVLFILVVLAIFLTGSRAAFGGLLIGLLIILLAKNSKTWIIAIFFCLIGYFIISNYPKYFSLLNRTEDINTSFDVRNEIWKTDLLLFSSNPILGIGIGNHSNYVIAHSLGGYYVIDNEIVYYGTESGYLQILIECGLLSFVLVLLLILIPVKNAVVTYIRFKNFNIICLVAAVISWMIAFTTVNSLSDKRILVLLITLLSLLIISKNSPKAVHV